MFNMIESVKLSRVNLTGKSSCWVVYKYSADFLIFSSIRSFGMDATAIRREKQIPIVSTSVPKQ